MTPWSRRRFLKAASGALLAAAGCRRADSPIVDYDVCIVGSGFAGTFLGLRLVERGIRTAILEAGVSLGAGDSWEGRQELFPVESAGDLGFPIEANRTIGLGGTSRKWSGVVSRLWPQDFEASPAAGLPGWPISYADVEPYYCQAEAELGVRGGVAVAGAEPPRRCAYPSEVKHYVSPAHALELAATEFFPLAFAFRGSGGALRLNEAHLPRFAASPGAALLSDHAVTRLVATRGVRVDRIEASRSDGSRVEVRARVFVVAAGVVETVRLLLASASAEHRAGLGNAGGLVGAHFNAHPRFRIALPVATDRAWSAGVHRTYSMRERLERGGGAGGYADLQLWRPPSVALDCMPELEPAATNRVRLLQLGGRGGAGRSLARLDANWSALDRRTTERLLAWQRDFARSISAGPFSEEPAVKWFHPAGGCRMAGTAADGVVDRDARVFGVDNLYLAGASIFPRSGSANPTLTIVALALRLGDHLARRFASATVG